MVLGRFVSGPPLAVGALRVRRMTSLRRRALCGLDDVLRPNVRFIEIPVEAEILADWLSGTNLQIQVVERKPTKVRHMTHR